MFSNHPEELVLTHDPQIGFSLVGACMRKGGGAWMRAVDIEARRVGWDGAALEAPGGGPLPTRREIAVRGRVVYVVERRELVAIDLLTGRPKWRALLGDGVEWTASRAPSGGLQIVEPFDPVGAGAVVVPTPERSIASFDRDTGKLLWRRSYERRITVHAVGRSGVVAIDLDGRLDLVRARDGDLVASFGGIDGVRVARVAPFGRRVVCVVREWGPSKREGVAIVDGDTGEVLSFDELAGARSRCAPLATPSGRVYCAVASRAGDRVAFVPGGMSASIGDDAILFALRPFGAAVVALARANGRRQAVAFDGRTLARRFTLDDLGELPDGSAPDQLQADDRCLVLAANPHGARTHCELRAFDDRGKLLWERAVGEWIGHYFLGGRLVCVSRGRLEILDPGTGRAVTAYPAA